MFEPFLPGTIRFLDVCIRVFIRVFNRPLTKADLEPVPVKIITDVFLPSVKNALEFEIHKYCEIPKKEYSILLDNSNVDWIWKLFKDVQVKIFDQFSTNMPDSAAWETISELFFHSTPIHSYISVGPLEYQKLIK